jgi:hypothetical protein
MQKEHREVKEIKETNIQTLAEDFILNKTDKSFSDLFNRLKPGVSNHCFLILKNMELAEDAFLNTIFFCNVFVFHTINLPINHNISIGIR